jgi:uncharacterized protein YbaR (Trm112 family)
MKPWLLNILACPIDKHHPLTAHIFEWETNEEEIAKITREAGKPNPYFSERYRHLANQIADDTISPESLEVVEDHTEIANTKGLLKEAVKAINLINEIKKPSVKNLLKNNLDDLDVLYRYFNLVEVKEGLLVCPECKRWYPIGCAVEGIPELMPDDLREQKEELNWLKKWQNKISEDIL